MVGDDQGTKQSAAHAAHVNRLEGELSDALNKYELVFRATHDIIYDLDLIADNVEWNRALYDQFGYSKDEATNTLEWWVAHIHPDDALNVEQGLYVWLTGTQSTWQSEYRFQKANGSYRYVLDRGFVTRGPSGVPLRIIGSLLDITPQKELEKAKDEFISLVSHQLRTPLTVIRVYGEMFADGLLGKLTKNQSQHVARMTDASVRLIKLVNEILDVSRVELGNFSVTRQPADLNVLIEACIQRLSPLANDKGVQISFTPTPECSELELDISITTQIIDNLLTNAIRYTRPGEGKIQVTSQFDNGNIEITVADNGIGIPRVAQKQVFDRFYRANNAVNIEEHGTGLGLYLVRILCNALGGRVWFESTARRGTTFYVRIPVA